MRTSHFLAGLSSAVLIGSAAAAQPAPPTQEQAGAVAGGQAGANAPSRFSDQQLSAFAAVTVELQRMQAEGASSPTAMAAAVQKSGLTVEQYNQMAAQMRSDPAFNARVQELAQSSGNEAGPAPQSGASTSPAP